MSPTPSPLLRVAATTARWALWMLALAWITVGLFWGGLHYLIVPRIGELRPWLEQQASAALGVQVRIGNVVARSNGLIPSFELSQVVLLDLQGREALRLPSVIAALSPRSALLMGFEQLYVESPVLEVRRSVDGRIWVAGLAINALQESDGNAADWLFSQTELAVRHGTVQWTDELRGAPPLALTGVDLVLRNRHLTHALRLDGDPPEAWGSRLHLSAVFKQPLLTTRSGNWREWQGQVYAAFDRIDIAQLRPYLDSGVGIDRGTGALRAWLDVDRAEVLGATADVALSGVQIALAKNLQPLALVRASGRVGVKQLAGGHEWFTESLAFDTQDGLHWPGGNVRLTALQALGKTPASSEIKADRLDLAALAEIGQRLPLGEDARALLARYAPRGLVEQMQASWQGPISQPERFAVKGRIAQLDIAAQELPVATPGARGLNLDLDMTQSAGKASVTMQNGSLDFPGVFEEPALPIDQLSTELQWTVNGERINASATKLKFSNADAQGEAQFQWQTAEPSTNKAGKTNPGGRLPGVLDLQGSLSRVEGARVFRYLPLAMDKEVRDYLRASVTGGTASNVKFKVKGNLSDFPFENAKQGDFKVTADIKNANYAFAPAYLLPKDSLPWPALTQVSADLVFEHATLLVKNAKGAVGNGGLQFSKADGAINNLYGASAVAVTAEAKGPLADVLGLVNSSPLGNMTGKVLAKATATGVADYRIKLAVPLAAVDRTTVQGMLNLPGNDVQVSPDTPRLMRVRGAVAFSETGFTVNGLQARALGGDVRLDGGLSTLAPGSPGTGGKPLPTTLRLQGSATAEGLRQAKELGFAARLAQYASGTASYTATLGVRSGIPELQVTSPLTGMALNLPAPFAKPADVALPVRLETLVLRSSLLPGARLQDQLQLDLGRLASIVYVRDVSGPQARVLRGAIGVGLASDEAAPLPPDGVVANVNMPQVDVDAWMQVLGQVSAEAGGPVASTNALGAMAYLPTSMAVRSKELLMGGRKLNNVVVGGARDGLLWRANVDATELSGYVEYRQSTGPTAGRLYARLARLAIAQSAAQDVENLLDGQPTSIPALDVVVEDFELRGKKLGRLEMEAVNLASGAAARDVAREWRLNRFNIVTPEAVLTASGNWTPVNASAVAQANRSIKERRRTVLNFKLDVQDAGDLLGRFGMPGVVRKGKGKIEGQVAWLGSPITLDYPSLGGSFNVDVETGQFLKAEPGIAKLLGVLSLQSLPRRLVLDFRDVFSEGFAFDFLRGDVTIEQGMARTNNLQMKGVNAAVLMEGQADIAKETQLLKVVVIPEINAGSASLIASAINPLVGLSTFLAQVILRRPLIEAATQEFQIDGTWVDPRVTKVERKN